MSDNIKDMDNIINTDTSAAPNYEGYEYQFLYFLDKVLRLRKDEEVGFEMLDDVHINSSDGSKTLIQVKHSIQNKKGNRPTFPTFDHDLWKTLTNWISLFSNEKLDLEKESKKNSNIMLDKLDDSYSLIIFTNRQKTKNKFEDILNNSLETQEKREALEALLEKTKDVELISRIHYMLRVPNSELDRFLSAISIEYSTEGIISSIYDYFEEMAFLESKKEKILGFLYLKIKTKISELIDTRKPTVIGFNERTMMFRKYFGLGRSKLDPLEPIENSYSAIPNKYEDSIFIQQLLDVGYIEEDEISEYARKLLDFKNYLLRNLSDGFIVTEEINRLDDNAKTLWKTTFKELYRDIKKEIVSNTVKEEDIVDVALTILDRLHREHLKSFSFDLDISQSNSEFYELSNRPEIGWHYNWKELYEKK